MKYSTSVIEMFMFKFNAEIYAFRARRHGYVATVVYEGENWYLLGGRWGVKLEANQPPTR